MKSKKKDYLFFGTVILLAVAIIGVSYAYFKLQIEGTGKDIVMDTGDLRLRYTDGDTITLNNAFPGDTVTKTVTVENIGTKDVSYSLYWSDLINTIERYELHVTLDCKSYTGYGTTSKKESGTCETINRAVPISDTSTSALIKNNLPIAVGVTHEYTITITFDNKEYEQNYNKKKNFTGKVDVREYSSPAPVYCTYDGELTQGAEFVKGPYTYRYKQEGTVNYGPQSSKNNDKPVVQNSLIDDDYKVSLLTNGYHTWSNISDDGWGVMLTNPDSSDAVTESPCTYINSKPVVSMKYMFSESQASSIVLDNFDASEVKDMSLMFSNATVEKLYLKNVNSSKVTDMSGMFFGTQSNDFNISGLNTKNVKTMTYMFRATGASEIKGIENLDTSNVTDMYGMFYGCYVPSLNVSSFDTSNVTNMGLMFQSTSATIINGYENFDTSNVTNMEAMFCGANIETIDVSNFDTSKVTNMVSMFSNGYTTEIKGLDKWNTSNTTNMGFMFYGCKFETLDLSSFDTSKVTSMHQMFYQASNLKTIYASDKFVTSSVDSDLNMFQFATKLVGGNGTQYSGGYVDRTYARIDTADTPGYFTSK